MSETFDEVGSMLAVLQIAVVILMAIAMAFALTLVALQGAVGVVDRQGD